jgi:hypothetical protein
LFNDFILHKFIPSVAKVLKARKQTSSYESTEIEVTTVNVELPTFEPANFVPHPFDSAPNVGNSTLTVVTSISVLSYEDVCFRAFNTFATDGINLCKIKSLNKNNITNNQKYCVKYVSIANCGINVNVILHLNK